MEEEKQEDEIYVTQSGRQTKRKLYTDDLHSVFSSRKPKSPSVQSKHKTKTKLTNLEIMRRSSLFKARKV